MNKEQLLNHYRSLYQIVKRDKDEIERELEEFKTLSTMKQDIINNLNNRIEILNKNNQVLENRLNELLGIFEGTVKITNDSITIRIN